MYHKGEIFTWIAGILALSFAICCGEMNSSLKLNENETGCFFSFGGKFFLGMVAEPPKRPILWFRLG